MIDLHYWPTPNGKKVTILLEECGLPYRVVRCSIGEGDQFKPEFLAICPNNRMPAIVDLHILRSHYFNDAETSALWTDPAEPRRFADLWRQISRRLGERSNDRVAYELLNEAVAPDDADWNRVWAHPFAAIREAEPGRTNMPRCR